MPLIQQSGSVAIGVPIGSGSSGSVLFVDSTGKLSQDNTNLNFNDTTNALTVGGDLLFVTTNVSSIGSTGVRPLKAWIGTGGLNSTGIYVAPVGLVGSPSYTFTGDTTTGLWQATSGAISFSSNGGEKFRVQASIIYSFNPHNFYQGATFGAAADVGLYNDGVGILSQRNGTNAQTFSVYSTYTDASNYQRLTISKSGSTFNIRPEYAGTSTSGSLRLGSTGASDDIILDGGGTIYFKLASTTLAFLNGSNFHANTTLDLGGTSTRWNKGWFGSGGIDSTGVIISSLGSAASNSYQFQGAAGLGMYAVSTSMLGLSAAGATAMIIASGTSRMVSTQLFGWASGSAEGTNLDTTLLRESAGVLAQRNGTNAQTFNIYGTYTDASNYFRGQLVVTSAMVQLTSTAAGTGASGATELRINGLDYTNYNCGTGKWHGFKVNLVDIARLEATQFVPHVTDVLGLGGTSNRWNKGWFGSGGLDLTGPITQVPANNTVAYTISGSTLTAANAQSLVSLSQTLNTSGSPTMFLANYLHTASGANTKLFDWQYASATLLSLRKDGVLYGTGANSLWLGTDPSITQLNTNRPIDMVCTGEGMLNIVNGFLGFNTVVGNTAPTVRLYRDASAILAQRNSTNAQAFRVYRTYTDASNHAYLEQTWSGNNALIRTIGLGTGTVGNIILQGSSSGQIIIGANCDITAVATMLSGNLQISASGFIYWASNRTTLSCAADGRMSLQNWAGTGYTALALGPETTSFPALVRNADGIDIMEATRVSYSSLKCKNIVQTVAGTFSVTSGTNQRAGNATLVGGTVTVNNTTITSNTIVILTRKTSGGTIGTSITYTLSAGTSFTITSDNILDTSTFSYFLIEVP